MMPSFFLPSSSSCWVVGSRFGSFPPPPSSRQVTTTPSSRWRHDWLWFCQTTCQSHSHCRSHLPVCVAWPCGTSAYIGVPYFIRLAGRRRVERDAVIATADLGKFPGGRCLAFPGGRGKSLFCPTVFFLRRLVAIRSLTPTARPPSSNTGEEWEACREEHVLSLRRRRPSARHTIDADSASEGVASISPHPVGVEIEARRGDPGNAVPVRRNQPCLFLLSRASRRPLISECQGKLPALMLMVRANNMNHLL